VIKSFRHRGVEKFFHAGSKAGIQPAHADRLRLQLFALDSARQPGDMNAPMEASSIGWRAEGSLGSRCEQELAPDVQVWGRGCDPRRLSGLSL